MSRKRERKSFPFTALPAHRAHPRGRLYPYTENNRIQRNAFQSLKIGIQDSLATAGGFLEDVIRLMRNKKEYRKFEWSGVSDGENKSRAKEEIYIFIL